MNDECSARWFMNLLLYSFVLVIHFLFPGGEYMNGVFRINNFRGRFVSTGRIPGRQFFFLFLSLSLWKISRNLDFPKFLWKINGTENSEPAGFSSCWRKVGELTTWPRKNLLPKKDLLAWIIFHILIFETVSLSRNYLLIGTYLSLSPPSLSFVFLQQLFHFDPRIPSYGDNIALSLISFSRIQGIRKHPSRV